MASILISTWGDPKGWHLVTYKIDGHSYPTKIKSSMPAIVKYASPKIEKAFIIVPDTMVKQKVSSYKELKDSVIKYYRDFLDSLGLDIQSEIIVAPGRGRFKLDYGGFSEFLGSLTDFQAYITLEVARRIIDLAEDNITVHLDLTHGVNFMPSLTYAAVSEILEALAIAKKINLKVYNADPLIPEATDELTIHRVEDIEVWPSIKNEALPQTSILLEPYPEVVREKDEVRNICDQSTRLPEKDVRELNAFLSSLVNGLPLVYYTFYPDANHLEFLLLNKAVDLWSSQIKVYHVKTDTFSIKYGAEQETSKNIVTERMVIERRVRFRREFTKLVIIWSIAKALNERRKSEIKISEIKKFYQRIFSKWPKMGSMISCEVEDIENAVKSNMLGEWTRLINISKEYEKEQAPPKESRLIRHFLAHSGFEWTLTYVKKVGNETYLSYNTKSREDIEKIFKACLKGLQQPQHPS